MLAGIRSLFVRFLREDDGAVLVEYALLVGLIALVAVGAISLLGNGVNTQLTNAANRINPQ